MDKKTEITEIKKALYREKPKAISITGSNFERKDDIEIFQCEIESLGIDVYFEVPVVEMGEKPFNRTMPAQLLIRWLV